jgi:mono/diheme cytochrome c family protein
VPRIGEMSRRVEDGHQKIREKAKQVDQKSFSRQARQAGPTNVRTRRYRSRQVGPKRCATCHPDRTEFHFANRLRVPAFTDANDNDVDC